ncbi:hypothetical protein PCAR4_150203 [Paraburkholderia caribensis]|nr:hypothetical protein PCAR4_150203 [Paraburkholderia caribensis]
MKTCVFPAKPARRGGGAQHRNFGIAALRFVAQRVTRASQMSSDRHEPRHRKGHSC